MHLHGQGRGEHGYAMAGLLVAIAVIHLMMTMAMPTWRQFVKRDKEAELVFRGEQYARAIELFQRKFAGAFPPDVNTLIEQRFLREKYKDPMTEDGEFQILRQGSAVPITAPPGQSTTLPGQPTLGAGAGANLSAALSAAATSSSAGGGIMGVVSKSKETSLMLYNGRNKYSEWVFMYVPAATQPGVSGQPGALGLQTPTFGGRGGVPGQPGGRGQPGLLQPPGQPDGRGRQGRPPLQQPPNRGFGQPLGPGVPPQPPPTGRGR